MTWRWLSRREDPDKRRATWSWVQFLGVCTCFVGLQMIWVFPGYVAQNTVASFIPFYTGYLLIVVPLLYVQMRVGGTTRRNIVALFSEYCPILKGIGIASVIRLFLVTLYFNIFIAYLIHFAISALKNPYRWSQCPTNSTVEQCDNSTSNFYTSDKPSEAVFFQESILEASGGISEEGSIPGHLGLSLVGAWAITFVCTMGGVRIFAWLMAAFGSVGTILAIALLAYGREEITHDFVDGDIYTPDWETLTEPNPVEAFVGPWLNGIWHAIVMAQAWSGIFPTLGKYNGKSSLQTNGRWMILLAFLCIIPHLFIYLVSTYMSGLAVATGSTVSDVMVGNTDPTLGNYTLVFINFPAAFHHLEMKRGVTFVFFFMTLLFAIQAQALWATVAIDNMTDFFRRSLTSCGKSCVFLLVSAIYCVLGIALGIPLVTRAGLYLVVAMMGWVDKLAFVIVFFSFIAFTVAYAKLKYNLCNKIGFLTWFVAASILSTALMLYKAGLLDEPMDYKKQVLYREDYVYPQWAYALGWLIAAGPIIIGLVFGAMHAVASAPGTKCEKCAYACCAGGMESSERISKDRKHNRMSGEGEEDYLDPKH